MSDPREDFLSKVVLAESHLLSFEGFIFLCGGEIDASENYPVSIRDALYRQIAKRPDLESRTRLAENYKDWSSDGIYSDLLVFEGHIAQLSAIIVLVLESPGSLAELGLFSAIQDFREKLVVFISNYHYGQTSFIRLGPVKYLEDTFYNKAECYPWIKLEFGREKFDQEGVDKIGDELLQSVLDRIDRPSKETVFSRDQWLHQALLICELIGLMSALTITEIKGYLEKFEIDVSSLQLRQTLFLLEKMEMISVEVRSVQRFYVSRVEKDFIRWKFEGGVLDRQRLQYSVIEHYEKTDKKRFRALQRVRTGDA